MPRNADEIVDSVLRAYDTLVSRPGKPQAHEWTCLSGIVAEIATSIASIGSLHVISIASGNKCLGRCDLRPDGKVVNDCHAEVLARRAFNRAMLDEIKWHVDNCFSTTSCSVGLLRHDPYLREFRLRDNVSLHLYISDAPCGIAAEVQCDKLEVTNSDALLASASAGRKSGARPVAVSPAGYSNDSQVRLDSVDASLLHEPPAGVRPDTFVSSSGGEGGGTLCTKSGRSDLPLSKRTCSMSCRCEYC